MGRNEELKCCPGREADCSVNWRKVKQTVLHLSALFPISVTDCC